MTTFSTRASIAMLVMGCAHTPQGSDGGLRPGSDGIIIPADVRAAQDDPLEMLAGRVSGVTIERTADGGIAVRIRGVTSFRSNQPLYILDGVPFEPGPGGSLAGIISIFEIASIEVLKNPVDTAMYGMRGANGVISIKAKRP
jgi:TonB-dependent SusC/RagA subfamily outer membrane receptor